jgi:hypothetical protein
MPPGALRLADLAFNSFAVLDRCEQAGVFFISRLQAGSVVTDAQAQRWHLGELLRQMPDSALVRTTLQPSSSLRVCEFSVSVGTARTAVRLIAQELPPEVAAERRRKMRQKAIKHQHNLTKTDMLLADWNLWITNVPVERLSAAEVIILARTRWQIEILFKRWKSSTGLERSRSNNPVRIGCEVFAKLLVALLEHWTLLRMLWHRSDASLTKATRLLRHFALRFAEALGDLTAVVEVLQAIDRFVLTGCRMTKRKQRPANFQLLRPITSDP